MSALYPEFREPDAAPMPETRPGLIDWTGVDRVAWRDPDLSEDRPESWVFRLVTDCRLCAFGLVYGLAPDRSGPEMWRHRGGGLFVLRCVRCGGSTDETGEACSCGGALVDDHCALPDYEAKRTERLR